MSKCWNLCTLVKATYRQRESTFLLRDALLFELRSDDKWTFAVCDAEAFTLRFFLHYYAVVHSTKTHSSCSGILQKRHSEENEIKKGDPFCIRLGHFSGTEQTITVSLIRLVLFKPFLFPDYFQTYLTSISCYTTVGITIVLTDLRLSQTLEITPSWLLFVYLHYRIIIQVVIDIYVLYSIELLYK